jgi:hypothetical protein
MNKHHAAIFFRRSSADTTKPTLVSAVIEDAADTIVVLTFTENLDGTLAAAARFGVAGKTISSRAAGATANIINLTLSAAIVQGESLTTSYTKNGTNDLADAAGNKVDDYTGVAITNNVVSSFVGDTFAATGTLGTASDGVAWNLQGYPWKVVSNYAWVDDTANNGYSAIATRTNAVGADCTTDWSEILVDGEHPGVLFRVVDSNNFHLIYFPNNGSFVIYRRVAGTYSSALLTSAGSQHTPNDVAHLVVQNNSTTGDITVTCNGNTPEVYNDATQKTASGFGMYIETVAGFSTSLAHFKTVSVT